MTNTAGVERQKINSSWKKKKWILGSDLPSIEGPNKSFSLNIVDMASPMY